MSRDPLKNAEAEYERLRGQSAMGRVTPDQYQAALKSLVIHNAQGRFWIINAKTAAANW